MFDVAPTELLLVAVVALVVIGPKDLPRAMRVVGQWVGRARGMARHFRSGIDEMIRQSELEDMEKKWREENERIMREFPTIADPVALPDHSNPAEPALLAAEPLALPAAEPGTDPGTELGAGTADLANWEGAGSVPTPEPVPQPDPVAPPEPSATAREEQLSLLPPDPPAMTPDEGKPQP